MKIWECSKCGFTGDVDQVQLKFAKHSTGDHVFDAYCPKCDIKLFILKDDRPKAN